MPQYSFRQVIGKRGCYASISLTTKMQESEQNQLSISYRGWKEWEYACITGIYVFFDYYWQKRQPGKYEIIIDDVDWSQVDTNHLIVLYATIDALSKHFDYEIPKLRFDKTEEVFIIPERRYALP